MNPYYFIKMPEDAAELLPDTPYRLLGLILKLFREKTKEGPLQVSDAELARRLRKSEGTIQRALARLDGAFIRRETTGRNTRRIHLAPPPARDPSPTRASEGRDTRQRGPDAGPGTRQQGPRHAPVKAATRASAGQDRRKSKPGEDSPQLPLFFEQREEENRNETLTAGASDGERRPEAPPVTPHAAPSSETPAAREAALRSHWAMLPTPEREAIEAAAKAANPGVARLRNLLEPHCLKALADRHPDLYPPLSMPAASPEPPAARPAPPPETSGKIEWLGRWGDVAAVPDLADELMLKLDDAHSADLYDGHLIPELARSGPKFAGLIAAGFRHAMTLPLPKRAREFGRIVKRQRSRCAQNRPPGTFPRGPGGRSERQSRPQLNGS